MVTLFSIPRPKPPTPTTINLSTHPPTLHRPPPPTTKPAFAALLRTASSSAHLNQLHAVLLTAGLSHKNSLITQLLISHISNGHLNHARKLFDEIHKPRVFLWNTIMRGYVNNNLSANAISIYHQMHRAGVRPDNFTFPITFKACAELLNLLTGTAAHSLLVKFGLGFDPIVRTELMTMYAKLGKLESADELFEGLSGNRDLVCWNALISAYAQNGHAVNALNLFRRMQSAGVEADAITLVSALSACAYLGCLELGKKIHSGIREHNSVFVENALLDMYAKCGCMNKARELFDRMVAKTVVSWSTMIGGYAIHGDSQRALGLFSQMRDEGVEPNHVTMLAVISACSHAGLVAEGKRYFYSMDSPGIEHYSSMVDLLARSGHLEEAYSFIMSMPIEPDAGVWGALLGACTIYSNVKLGQIAADQILILAPEAPSYRVLLSNIYAASGRWIDVEKVRALMRGNNVKKIAGYSSVEMDGEVHLFYEGSHTQSKEIYTKLDELTEQLIGMGYAPETLVVLHDVECEEKAASVRAHSEKLAIIFSLIKSKNSEAPIRIIKNLRICSDCHAFCKYASRALGREIIMRDKTRFHRFTNGECSCKDFW